MRGWSNTSLSSVPDEPDLELNRGVVSDRVLDACLKTSAHLTALGIAHFVIGGLAVGAWGHPRATKDIDFLVLERQVFDGKVFVTFKPGIPINADGVAIDYLTAESLGITEINASGEPAPIELLFLMKLRAHRKQDQADVVALITAGAPWRRIDRWLEQHELTDERNRLGVLLGRSVAEEG